MKETLGKFGRFMSIMLALALLLGIVPIGAVAEYSSDIPFRSTQASARSAVGDGLYDAEEGTLHKVDVSKTDLTGLRNLPTQSVSAKSLTPNNMAKGDSLTEEELSYVEEYAEMLTEPVGIVDVDGDEESAYVFVWLQSLPQALEDAYQRHGMRNRNYERVRELGRKARGSIKSKLDRQIVYEFNVVFSGFTMEATMSQLEEIAAMEGVFAITEVTYQQMDYTPDPEYKTLGNLGARELMDIGALHTDGIDGTGIKVGVIDSGIDTTHPDLVDALKGGYNFAPRGTLNTTGRSPGLTTPDGNHGTHVSGIIASQGHVMSLGLAPGVDLYMAQVFTPDRTNSASTSDIAAALEAFSGGNPSSSTYPNVNLPKVDVVNMSLGSDSNTAYQADFVTRNNAVIAGIVLCNSAGNNAYPTSNTTERRNYTLGTGGVSLPISVAASQYGGNPILSYKPTVCNNAGATGTLDFFCENGDSSFCGVFRDGSFGSLETRSVTYGPLSPPDTVNTWLRATYTIAPLVYIAGKGYELHYACANNVPTAPGTTGSDMTPAEIATLHALPAGSLAGKILVVNRGQAFFEYKCQALRLGAAGLIVINRDEAVIGNLNIGSETSAKDMLIFSAPASFKRTLYDLVQGGETAYLDPGALAKTAHAAEPADFSSIGPVNETAEIKPDIIAPGYAVLSTDLDGGYTEMGGTSMSSPLIAAVAALVKQRYPTATPAEVKARIMNTADPDVIKPLTSRLLSNNGFYFNKDGTQISVYEQGAGFVNPKRAVYNEAFIFVTNYDIPTGSSTKETYPEASMASFSFGQAQAGNEEGPSLSKTLTATAYGGTVSAVRATYNTDTRYSNKNLNNAVVVKFKISDDAKSFDVWLEIDENAGVDQTNGNLYEGYIFATVNGVELVLPWAVRVGEYKAPVSDDWLVYFDRPIQVVRGTAAASMDWSPYSSQNVIYFMFGGEDVADDVELRIVTSGTGNNRRYTYYLDFYLISDTPALRLAYRVAVSLAANLTVGTLTLSDFIDIGDTYFVAWGGQANSISSTGVVSGTASNVTAGTYYISVPFSDSYDWYDELGVVLTNTRPLVTIEDRTLTTGTTTNHKYPYGSNEVTVNGRLFSAATQTAADKEIFWAGYYLLNYDLIFYIDQSLNVLVDAGTGLELEFYDDDFGEEVPWFCDEDGYFSLTLDANDDGYFFPEDICPSGVVYCADAFDVSLLWTGTGTAQGNYVYGAMASFQWCPLTFTPKPITMIRIDAGGTVTVVRGGKYSFDVILNSGGIEPADFGDYPLEWSLSNPIYGTVDNDGNVVILNKTGTVTLKVLDPVSGKSALITLRIV